MFERMAALWRSVWGGGLAVRLALFAATLVACFGGIVLAGQARRRESVGTPAAWVMAATIPPTVTSTRTPTVTPRPTVTPAPTNTPPPTLTPAPTYTSSPIPPSATPRPTATRTPVGFGDGTHQVGVDIKSGRYRTTSMTGICYYARLSGFGGSLGEILANDNARGRSAIVDILSTDAGFQSRGCGRWVVLAGRVTASPTAAFGDGAYLVGTDIASGTWRTAGGANCYYARLSNFTGDLFAIIANDNARGAAIVTLAATDIGFMTRGCGDWSR